MREVDPVSITDGAMPHIRKNRRFPAAREHETRLERYDGNSLLHAMYADRQTQIPVRLNLALTL